MKRKSIAFGIIICFLLIMAVLIAYKLYRNSLNNTLNVSNLNGVDIVELSPIKYIELPSALNGHALTTTGISYNMKKNCFYIGNYGRKAKRDKNFYPSIVEFSSDFSKVNDEFLIKNKRIDVQGIAYDESDNSIWYTDYGKVIKYSIDKAKHVDEFSLGKYAKYKANGICIDTNDGSLWVLCTYKYLLNYNKTGELINVYDFGFIGQDHVFMDERGYLYISVGNDYSGKENYIICLDKNANIKNIYRVKDSYAIEGVFISGSKLYVVNDGIYHEAKIKNNYIQVYEIN